MRRKSAVRSSRGDSRAASPCSWLAALALLAAPAAAQQMSLDYLTFHGGGQDVAVDAAGYQYVLGSGDVDVNPGTCSTPSGPGTTTWLAKLDSSTGAIVWSRFYAGGGFGAIAVDPSGSKVYVAGRSAALGDFNEGWFTNVTGTLNRIYVASFHAATGCPDTLTYLGPAPNDTGAGAGTPHDMVVTDDAVLVVCESTSSNWEVWEGSPVVNMEGYVPVPIGPGARVAILASFTHDLQDRNYLAYLPGGSGFDSAQDVEVDAAGHIYVAGASASTDHTLYPGHPKRRPDIGPLGGQDAVVMKLDPLPAAPYVELDWATFVGGSGDECAQGSNQAPFQSQGSWLSVDDQGGVTLTGWTVSTDTQSWTWGAWANSSPMGQDDIFVTKLDNEGYPGAYSTLLGGSRIDVASGIARLGSTVYVVGSTKSVDFPTPDGLVTQAPNRFNAFLLQIDDLTGELLSGTYLGGSGDDDAWAGVESDGQDALYVSGTKSNGFQPQPYPNDPSTYDIGKFAAKIRFSVQPPTPGVTVVPTSGLETTEAGGTDGFTVVLDTQPTAAVWIDVRTSAPLEGNVSSGAQGPATIVTLQFDALDWNVPQTVTVHGVDDFDLDGDVAYTIVTGPALSADPGYAGLPVADVAVTNLDDEVPPAVVVQGIEENWMLAGTEKVVTITGSGFQDGASVTFEAGTAGTAGPAPTATNVVVGLDGSSLTATLSVGGQGPKGDRLWSVRVTNPDSGWGLLADAFTVTK